MIEMRRLLDLADELLAVEPTLTQDEAIATVAVQVAVAGWPAAGRGMVADHEWTGEQQDAIDRDADGLVARWLQSGSPENGG